MTNSRKTARIHLLPAKDAPYCVLLRRKPSRWVHVMRWNTDTDEVEHGSWFNGRIYELYCDVSWDGEWLFYFAAGAGSSETWRAISRAPRLTAVKSWEGSGTWGGGAYWQDRGTLITDFGAHAGGGWLNHLFGRSEERVDHDTKLPFTYRPAPWFFFPDGPVATLLGRLNRDGWEHVPSQMTWTSQPTPQHPTLRLTYLGYQETHRFDFALDGVETVVENADWACWSNTQELLVSKHGQVHRYGLSALRTGKPDAKISFEHLEVPPERLNYRPPVPQENEQV